MHNSVLHGSTSYIKVNTQPNLSWESKEVKVNVKSLKVFFPNLSGISSVVSWIGEGFSVFEDTPCITLTTNIHQQSLKMICLISEKNCTHNAHPFKQIEMQLFFRLLVQFIDIWPALSCSHFQALIHSDEHLIKLESLMKLQEFKWQDCITEKLIGLS